MEINKNSFVEINYTGKLKKNGMIFDTSEGKEPLSFIFGKNMIIPGLEEELVGMKKGDKKTIEVSKEKAYGNYNENAIQEIPKTEFPKDIELKKGTNLVAQTPYGPIPIVIKEVKDESVLVDFNHPLAGKDLIFEVEVVNVRDATEDDLKKFNLVNNNEENFKTDVK